jgi:hypothetical protein
MTKARLATVAVAAAALVATATAGARPQKKADLVERAIGSAPAQLTPGASFTLASVVVNRGAAKAGASVTRYFLRTGQTALVAGVARVPALAPHRRARGSAHHAVPASAGAATYAVVACADALRAVAETNERNNCRTAHGQVTVAAAPAPAPPPPPPPAPGVADSDQDGTPDNADCASRDRSIHPGAADKPDLAFVDSNCDGIDGDASHSIFVDPTGRDTDPGSRARPMRTVRAAVAKAGPDELPVLVAVGSYDEGTGVELRDSVGIYGGYVAGSWSRTRSSATVIVGSPQAALADGDTRVTLQLLTLRGNPSPLPGESTYAVRALDHSALTLEGSRLVTADGRPGARGADGTAGAGGVPGAEGRYSFSDDGVGPGGAGGASPIRGGRGGNGGLKADHDGEQGAPGNGTSGGAGGAPGEGGRNPTNGQPGSPGGDGLNAGLRGTSATNATDLAGAVWRGHDGGAGSTGDFGSGGGGGGGGGGLVAGFLRFDLPGCGGGGGGAGGAGGGGGRGGQAGGGSFGIYLVDSAVTLSGTTVEVGAGGAGGVGGAGGIGGHGGDGGGVSNPDEFETRTGRGAPGAKGGDGARGGDGAGGAGGPSIGVFKNGDSTAVVGTGVTITAGAAGHGGNGAQTGISARVYPTG